MNDIIDKNQSDCANFTFKLPSLDNDTLVAILKNGFKKISEYNIQLYFTVDNGSYNESQIAKIGASSHDSNAINVVFKTQIYTDSIDLPRYCDPYDQSADSNIDLIDVFLSCLRSDRPDNLFTTVVCDEHDICLGLVYSNAQSLRIALCDKRGVYWSRSRGGLWKKGESSGMYQELLAITYDCDGDALRFSVIQKGEPPSFCHLMTRTCWGNTGGIQKLENILVDRKKSAPVGSYTKRLFDDPNLLQKKLLEECQELIEATDPDHVAAEAADVMYFMMTRCVAAGVGLKDIEKHLDKRTLKVTRRPGNAKEWRTQNAKQILSEK
jgi:phosphoribosyl-ATP pyrophosphohydrolase